MSDDRNSDESFPVEADYIFLYQNDRIKTAVEVDGVVARSWISFFADNKRWSRFCQGDGLPAASETFTA